MTTFRSAALASELSYHYNDARPHSALKYQTPMAFAMKTMGSVQKQARLIEVKT